VLRPQTEPVINLRRSLETVLATGQADAMALQRYNVPVDRNGPSVGFVQWILDSDEHAGHRSDRQITKNITTVSETSLIVQLHRGRHQSQLEAAQLIRLKLVNSSEARSRNDMPNWTLYVDCRC
jgi:hypothetical protein